MPGDSRFVVDLMLVLLAGFGGAMLAHFVRLPLIAGYLLAGFLLGPSALGLLRDSELISQMAEFGVAMLMFTIGVELSVGSLLRTRSAALVAAPFQILLTIALGYSVGLFLMRGEAESLVLGFILALSSTMVVVKLLSVRGELHTRHGQAMVAILLAQDLVAVLMVAALPMLSDLANHNFASLFIAGGKAVLFVVLVVVFARSIAPFLLRLAAKIYSKEMFIIMAAAICFTGAAAGHLLGLSLAIGAFAAGLVISESHYSHEILSDVTPLRDLFGMVFFVSLGLLFDAQAVQSHWVWIIALALAVFLGKPIIAGTGLLAAGYHIHNAVIGGFGLAQIGEFSFLITALAWRLGLLSQEMHSTFIAVASLSLLLTPAMVKSGSWLYHRLRTLRSWDSLIDHHEREAAPGRGEQMSDHVLLCGYGRVGKLVGDILLDREISFVVIDFDQAIIAELTRQNIPAIYGDASRPAVLEAAGAARARLAVVALPGGPGTRLAVRYLRQMHAGIKIVARAHQSHELEEVCRDGATEAVYAEYAAGIEMLRHTLLFLGGDSEEIEALLSTLRENRYCRLVLEQEEGEAN